MTIQQKKQIHILGGGMGALSAAYHLSSLDGWQENYVITVYQVGWRLGGKAASSRNPQHGYRIEEHGLHCWMGYYENAFTLLREAYAELDPQRLEPYFTVEQAFIPRNKMSTLEPLDQPYTHWHIRFPKRRGKPGVGEPRYRYWRVLGWTVRTLQQLSNAWCALIRRARPSAAPAPDATAPARPSPKQRSDSAPSPAGDGISNPCPAPQADDRKPAPVLAAISSLFGRQRTRRLAIVVNLLLASIRGVWADRLLERGLHAIDDEDFRAWLRRHGASRSATESAPIHALYSSCFCYADGDLQRPTLAAGCALGLMFRTGLLYRGHVCYQMKAGMGDVVIKPMYELLVQRGVQFEFFSRIKLLELGPDKSRIAKLHLGRQVHLKDRSRAYQPLARCAETGVSYWPDQPRYDQIVDADTARLRQHTINLESEASTWQDVEDVVIELAPTDQVVLGIPATAQAGICSELMAADHRWREMIAALRPVPTQAIQIWSARSAENLGAADLPDPATMVGLPGALCVGANMSHLLEAEHWQGQFKPKSLFYFCGPLNTPPTASRPDAAGESALPMTGHVLNQSKTWIRQHGHCFWASPELIDRVLRAHEPTADAEPDDATVQQAQVYVRANVEPSDCYISSPAGGNSKRLPADRSGFDNLVLAGDWTRTTVNTGCIEAAVISGKIASRAITGSPRKIIGEYFLHR